MRTTLDLPEALLEEARRLLGFKSKTDTVVASLRELTAIRSPPSAMPLHVHVVEIGNSFVANGEEITLLPTLLPSAAVP
jgi:hypothetical protein